MPRSYRERGYKQIMLPIWLVQELDKLKANDSESYADVIKRLIEVYLTVNSTIVLRSRRSRVQIPAGPPTPRYLLDFILISVQVKMFNFINCP